ncbi:hypothetical protein [Gordonia malaquae]|uniref:hypothetical protein n=1 Tax=Gordonia malaquae TaxID=410332 RepID=UPI0030FF336B
MTTNHSRGRERHDRGTLLAGLIALTALAAAVLLAISLAPASAETPAERCKRETTAYNNAWKNSWAASHPGKKPSDAPKPPVPYKCGSNNDGPPPTVQPTSTAPDAPAETAAPNTKAPNDSAGPSMNQPTERRDIQHPEKEQRPLGGVPQAGLQASRSPQRENSEKNGRAGAEKKVPTKAHKPTGIQLGLRKANDDVENYDQPVGSIGGQLEGQLISPPDGYRIWTGDCPTGFHKKVGWTGDRCYSNYDYVIRNVRWVGSGTGQEPVAHAQCGGETKWTSQLTTGTSTTVSSGAEVGLGNDVANAKISGSIEQTESKDESTAVESTAPTMDRRLCPPGREMVARQVYEVYEFDLDKVHTMSGTVVETIPNNRTILWSQSARWELV